MAKNCGNCEFFSNYFCSGICTNPGSKRLAEFVGKGDYCKDWRKKKENKGVKE